MKFIVACSLLLFISSCIKAPKESITTGAARTPGEFRWKSIPQDVYFASDLPLPYQNHATLMMNSWNDSTPNAIFFSRRGVSSTTNYTSLEATTSDGLNTIYLIQQKDMPEGSQGALAVTVLMGRVNNNAQFIIEEADILIRNGTTGYDVETIIIHELGHLMGVQHIQKKISVMYPSIELEEKKTLDEVDIAAIRNLYHISSGVVPAGRKKVEIEDGRGDLSRMIFELGADKTCRHLLEGVEIHSHKTQL